MPTGNCQGWRCEHGCCCSLLHPISCFNPARKKKAAGGSDRYIVVEGTMLTEGEIRRALAEGIRDTVRRRTGLVLHLADAEAVTPEAVKQAIREATEEALTQAMTRRKEAKKWWRR